ncbi:MAG: DIP1984 family protein [Oscillospiraceae bacterium]|nr:DIP1984 family protein [Oscillospiraceae bacterium]
MKLAEALQERADLNRRIEQLRSRVQTNALVQEGEKPAEDPQKLLRELDECFQRLEYLIRRINLTNCRSTVEGRTLTELIARKDVLRLRQSAWRDILYAASQTTSRARGTEIRILPTMSVAELQQKTDDLARELRLLDNTIQQANWAVELIEE